MAVSLDNPGTYSSNTMQPEAELSPLESLPDEILWIILELSKDSATLSRISLTSRRFYTITDQFVRFKLRLFENVSYYLPRQLTVLESAMPPLRQLSLLTQIVNEVDAIGRTPLIKATLAVKVKPWEQKALRTLIILGADIDQKIKKGWTAADFAAYWQNTSAAALIKEMRAEA